MRHKQKFPGLLAVCFLLLALDAFANQAQAEARSTVLEDRSKGVHNFKYAVQLLTDSIRALDPAFDDTRRPD